MAEAVSGGWGAGAAWGHPSGYVAMKKFGARSEPNGCSDSSTSVGTDTGYTECTTTHPAADKAGPPLSQQYRIIDDDRTDHH